MAEVSQMSDKEIQDKIKKLQDMGETDAIAKYQAELSKRKGGKKSAATGAPAASGVTASDWDKAGSKFAKEGLHPAEFYAGEWKTVNGSVNLHFTITDGEDKGKEGDIVAGIGANAIWKFKEICKALDVDPVFRNGVLDVAAMFPAFAGKVGMVQYITRKDTRTPEEGGRGGSFTSPASVFPSGSVAEEPPF